MIRLSAKFMAIAICMLSTALLSDLALQTQVIVKDAEAATREAHKRHHRHERRARRTTRRIVRSTHVHVRHLPAHCSAVIVDGVHLHRCGGVYYRPHGSRYVVVVIE